MTIPQRLVRAPEWIVLLPFTLSRLALLAVGSLARLFPGLLHTDVESAGVWTARRWLDVWFRWDSGHYARLVEYGYDLPEPFQASTAFFPLYPTLVRALYWLVAPDRSQLALEPHTAAGDAFILSGVILTNVCFIIALMLLYRLVAHMETPDTAASGWRTHNVAYLAVLYLCVAPASFVFSSFLTESLFLLLTVGAFYAAERGGWLAAGVLAGLAALTRSLGVLLALPLAVLWWGQYRRGAARPFQTLPLLLAPLGVLLFMVILQRGVGDPLAFIHHGEAWGMARAWPWVALLSDSASRYLLDSVDRGLTLLFIALALGAFRLGPAYGLWALIGTVGALALKGNAVSMGRYMMVVFPAFIVLARFGRRWPYVHDAIIISFTALMAVLMALSAENFWVV